MFAPLRTRKTTPDTVQWASRREIGLKMDSAQERVCILDDDPLVLQFLQLMLEAEGIAVRTFDRASEFLDYAQTHPMDVAVLDVLMPGSNGLKVQERLSEISPAARVIMITGQYDPAVHASAMNRGAIGVLVKPFRSAEFRSLVRNALTVAV